TRLANTVSGYADKFVQKFGLNLQSTSFISGTQKIVHFLSIRSSFFVVFYVVNLTPACPRG
ncbi:hypothetical protein JYG89_10185, partial [Latilactobacillus curvatus]|uniref:hypothetical protein n=1 Tax=Latilactobacillus curvatus TaxID=28038 RepID=UPI001CBD2C08